MTLNEIWETFSRRLKRFILKRVPNELDAEDILQDVFYKIQTHIHQLRDGDRLEFWLYRITRNAINDFYRCQNAKVEPAGDLEEVTDESAPSESVDEVGACLRPMVNLLPKKYSQALILTEFDGLTQEAMAERLKLSISGAKSRVQRGRARLREMLLAGCNLEFDHLGNLSDCWPKETQCDPG